LEVFIVLLTALPQVARSAHDCPVYDFTPGQAGTPLAKICDPPVNGGQLEEADKCSHSGGRGGFKAVSYYYPHQLGDHPLNISLDAGSETILFQVTQENGLKSRVHIMKPNTQCDLMLKNSPIKEIRAW
jgi:hypothetical protein